MFRTDPQSTKLPYGHANGAVYIGNNCILLFLGVKNSARILVSPPLVPFLYVVCSVYLNCVLLQHSALACAL